MEYIEVTGRTKDDAIIKASMQLETPSDELEIQVISEGSKGFLGFGSKPAVIRVRKKEKAEEKIEKPEIEKAEIETKPMEDAENGSEKDLDKKPQDEGGEIQSRNPAPDAGNETEARKPDELPGTGTVENDVKKTDSIPPRHRSREYRRREPRQIEIITDEQQIEEVKKKAEVFLTDVFQAMNIEANIHSVYNKTDGSLAIDFTGDDMGILIGKRGQTLDSLQYLTGLVINKGKNSYVKVKLDTENYRARRKETLENLARGIASRVRKTREDVVLEPMNPYERRIIHSTLQGNHYVETVSEGEEPYRHIVVKPKRYVRR